MRLFAKAVFAFLLLMLPLHGAKAQSNIQMLPPLTFGTSSPCAGGMAGMLFWDGINPLYCIPGFMGDANGDISVNGNGTAGTGNVNIASWLKIGGIGPLTSTSASVLMSLQEANCTDPNQVLTIRDHVVSCTTIASVPTCTGTGRYLQYDGTTFSCYDPDAVSAAACDAAGNYIAPVGPFYCRSTGRYENICSGWCAPPMNPGDTWHGYTTCGSCPE